LIDPIVWTKTFLSIHVEYWNEQQHHIIQHLLVPAMDHNVPQKHQARIFAFDLTSMNARLKQYNCLVRGLASGRVELGILVQNQQGQLASLEADAKAGES